MAVHQYDKRVFLKREADGIYTVIKDGEIVNPPGLSNDQMRNPMLAKIVFVQTISELLGDQIRCYLRETEQNPTTGCAVKLHCDECKKQGLNSVDNCCMYDNGRAELDGHIEEEKP